MIPFLSTHTGAEIDSAVSSVQRLLYTALTGGAAGALDATITVGMAVGTIARVINGATVYHFQLTSGTDAENSPLVIRPDDYNAGTNHKVWVLQSVYAATLNAVVSDAITNDSTVAMNLGHRSSNTPIAGYGTKLVYRLQTGSSTIWDAGYFNCVWRDAAQATHSAGFEMALADQGANPAVGWYFEYATTNGKRLPSFGLGTRPLRQFHVKFNYIDPNSMCAFENDDTTDGNGVVMSFRTTTTGVGANSFQELAGFKAVFSTHDHSTRKGEFQFYCINGGTPEIMKWRPGNCLAIGDLTTQNISLSRATSGVWQMGDGDANANGWLNYAGQKRVTTQFDKTNTTLADVTGLSVNLKAGRSYRFRAVLFVTASAAGGGKYAMGGTATATAIVYHIKAISDTTNAMVITSRQTALAGSSGQTGATTVKVEIEGLITVNAAGTFTVQFAQNAASGTSSVLVGSHMKVDDFQ